MSLSQVTTRWPWAVSQTHSAMYKLIDKQQTVGSRHIVAVESWPHIPVPSKPEEAIWVVHRSNVTPTYSLDGMRWQAISSRQSLQRHGGRLSTVTWMHIMMTRWANPAQPGKERYRQGFWFRRQPCLFAMGFLESHRSLKAGGPSELKMSFWATDRARQPGVHWFALFKNTKSHRETRLSEGIAALCLMKHINTNAFLSLLWEYWLGSPSFPYMFLSIII